jgi:putative lipoic acid-binding regulatory protein
VLWSFGVDQTRVTLFGFSTFSFMSASSQPPNSTDAQRESLIEYPCDFPVKVMGARVDGFAEAMCLVAQQFDPSFDPATLEMRASKAGNYLSVTLTIRATSREQLDNLYLALTGHPMVKVAL